MKQHTVEEVAEQISLYVLGAAGKDEAELFEAHLAEGCGVCAEEIRSFDPVIISLADSAPADPPGAVRDRLKSFLATEARPLTGMSASSSTLSGAAEILKIRSYEGNWETIGKGLLRKVLFVDTERHTVTFMLRMEPGARLPPHRHEGVEECILLEGDVHSDTETYTAGDYMCAPVGSMHEPLFTMNGALMFILAGQEATA